MRVVDAPEGERKTVTALFADIKGSMELMEYLDPEEARAIVDPALKLMIEAVQHYGGYIVQSTGDGVFALFGAPAAYEDHPQRALYAALLLQDGIRTYSGKLVAEGGTPLEARVGINTGEVVVRTLTSPGHAEYTPIGHTVNLAARMQAVAPTGSIAISEQTQHLVEGYFRLKPRGPTRVKGLCEPINVYEVVGLGPLRTRLQRAAGRGLTKFVGRVHEMEVLKRALEMAEAGHGQLVAAMGEPGVGKSRLFHEFKATSHSRCMVLEAYSVSHSKASAYLPVVELLQGYFKIISDDDPRTRREKITGRVLALDRALEEPLPYLFALFGLADEKDALAGMDASIRKRRTLDAIKRIVLRESLNQPLVLIFEDLHWIDEQTQEFLNLFADSIGTAKILLLVNYRPEYSHSWSNKTYYEQIRLDPLGRESADEMLATLLGVDADLAPLKRLIIEKTEGTPFFMEEMVQALFEQQVLARNGRVHLTQPLSELKIPSTVQAMLSARIDRLPADEKDLLQTLAVIGREFSASLVHAVVGQYDDRLDTMLDDLQLREFIYEQPAAGEADYIFKHALTQEVAYSSILAERRQFLHSHIAQAIESLAGARVEEHIEELAHHYSRSANLAKAVHYLQRAGEQAAARSFHEAISYLSTAIEFLKKLPSSSARDAQELVIRMALVNPLFVINPLPVADLEQNLRRAQVPCKQLGKTEVMAHVLLNLFFVYWCIGDLGKQREAAQAGMEIASREPSEITVFCAGWTNGFLSAWTGQYDSARVHLERALSIRPSTEALLLKDPAIAISLVDCIEFLGFTLWMLGYPEQARRYEQRLADLANSSIDAFAWAVAVHGILMMRCQFFRDFRGMKQRAEELLRSASEGAASYWVVFGQVWLGRVTVAEGEFAAGIRMLEDGMNASFARGDAGTYDLFRYTAAATYLQAGVVERGMTAVREGITQIPATGLFSAELYRLQGEFLLLAGALEDEAEKSFRQAIRIAQPQGAKSWELRATMSLARLLAKQAKRDEARTMLAGIYDWFTEGFGTADLEEAKALLDKLIA